MYQVLARQWRPKNFHELVGQTHVAEALSYALDHDRVHHAHLFTGTRGVGKTTIARIFAKSLNCLTNGVSSHPCGQCEHCREIDDGRFPDLLEVDAASQRRVENFRELLESIPYAPVKGRYKVYLLDEVHMLTPESFNTLLKTLEEPPLHVKFVLATTDPQKMPATVLSRCLQFHLKNLTPRQIGGHLAAILQHENIAFDDEALMMIARAGNGSMRDALSLLDQAIAFGQGEVRTGKAATLLGSVPAHHFITLMEAMAHQDCASLRRILGRMDEYSPDYVALFAELMAQFQRVTVLQLGAQQPDEYFEPDLVSLAGRLPVELMQLWYQIATDSWQYFPYQPSAGLAFEMMLLRMAALQPLFPHVAPKPIADLSNGDDETLQMAAHLGQKPSAAEASSIPPVDEAPLPAKPQQAAMPVMQDKAEMEALPPPWQEDAQENAFHDTNTKEPFPTWQDTQEAYLPWEDDGQTDEAGQVENMPAAPTEHELLAAVPALSDTVGDVDAWALYARHLPKDGGFAVFVENGCPIDWQPPRLTLQVPFVVTGFDDGRRLQALAEAIVALSGEPCEIELAVNDAVMTPGIRRHQVNEAEQLRAEQAFYAHEVTQRLKARLDAKIQPQSIQSMKIQTE